MITLFDLLCVLLPVAGASALGASGYLAYGLPGAVIGGAGGLLLGWVLWRGLGAVASRLPDRRTTDQIRANLRSGSWQTARGDLIELARRGEDISDGLPLIRSMLLSNNGHVRAVAYATLREHYPDEFGVLEAYDPESPSSESLDRVRARPHMGRVGPAN